MPLKFLKLTGGSLLNVEALIYNQRRFSIGLGDLFLTVIKLYGQAGCCGGKIFLSILLATPVFQMIL